MAWDQGPVYMPHNRALRSVARIFPIWMWIVLTVGGTIAGWFLIPLFFETVQMLAHAIGWVLA